MKLGKVNRSAVDDSCDRAFDFSAILVVDHYLLEKLKGISYQGIYHA